MHSDKQHSQHILKHTLHNCTQAAQTCIPIHLLAYILCSDEGISLIYIQELLWWEEGAVFGDYGNYYEETRTVSLCVTDHVYVYELLL